MNTAKIYAFADEADKQMEGQIQAMVRNGLQGLEIRGVDGENVSKISLDKAKEVRKMLDDNGLITWSIGSPIGKIKITDAFEPHLEELRHTLEIADILGAKNMRLFSFYMTEQPQQWKQKVIDRMGAFLEMAKNSDVRLCHENEKGIYGDTAQRCLQLFQALPELGGIFDPANFVQSGEDTLRCWNLLKNHIHYLHIKDSLADGSVVPAGKGCGNVAAIVKDYLAMGGSAMTLEPHLTVFDGLKGLEGSGDTSVVGAVYTFDNAAAAFDAGCDAIKEILAEIGG